MVVSIPDIKMTGLCVEETVLGTNKSNALKNKWLKDMFSLYSAYTSPCCGICACLPGIYFCQQPNSNVILVARECGRSSRYETTSNREQSPRMHYS